MSNIPPPPGPTSPAPPGVVLPTVLPLTTATSTPQQSAYQAGVNASNTLSQRNNLLSAGSRRRKGGANASSSSATTYKVPQFNMLYNPNMGTGQTPNNIIQSTVGTMGQNTAYAQYDTCVGKPAGCTGQLGGTKVCNSSDTHCWGCYSGGRKKSGRKRKIFGTFKTKTERKRRTKKNNSKKRRTFKRGRKHFLKHRN